MSKLSKLINDYYNHKFVDDGAFVSKDYVSFQAKYRNVLKEIGQSCGMELYSFNKNHYEFSCVMKSNYTNQFYYLYLHF